jgi:hypothetical protein
MSTFTIDAENNITTHAGLPTGADELQSSSAKELAKLTEEWPVSRLVDIWNSLAGVAPFDELKPVKKFTSSPRSKWRCRGHGQLHHPRGNFDAHASLLPPGPLCRSRPACVWGRPAIDRLARGRDEFSGLVALVLAHQREQLPRAWSLRQVHSAQRVPAIRRQQSAGVIPVHPRRALTTSTEHPRPRAPE